MPLTDVTVKNTNPRDRDFKLFDGGGLYLLITKTNGRWWRLKYRFEGREKLLSLGTYPSVSLKTARAKRDEFRRQLAAGIDPGQVRQATRSAQEDTFEAIAREWYAQFSKDWADTHKSKVIRRLEMDIFPWIGNRPIRKITAPDILACLRRVEDRGAIDTAHRARQNVGQVFRYAISSGRAEHDPAAHLKGALRPAKHGHFASIKGDPAIGTLMRVIDGFTGTFVVKCALRLAPLVFIRPGELRKAEWQEIDLDGALWTIPAKRMKGRLEHIVPLSTQAVAIFRELKPLTGDGKNVFPGRSGAKWISENTLNGALRRLGYENGELSTHGLRHMASTTLNEQKRWDKDVIERQLAHTDTNKIRGIYNSAEYLSDRREMMQDWADHLDALRTKSTVVQISRKRA